MAIAAKPIVSVFIRRGPREPMMDRLASAIERRTELATERAEFADEPTQPGLVPCDECAVPVQPRGGYYSVHFPKPTSTTPCPRSWPPKVKR